MYKALLKDDPSATNAILPGGLMISGGLPSGELSVTGALVLPH
jgi:hypothetical protein